MNEKNENGNSFFRLTHIRMLIFVLFLVIYADDCTKKTPTLTNHGISNANDFFFSPQTYGGHLNCANVKTNNDYRKLINTKFPCIGAHCVKASSPWGCIQYNSQNCYNVEHIIPEKHNIPELEGCNVNVHGNLIMAYGLWNQQLSNTFFYEKKLIYGDIFIKAYDSVYYCCKGQIPTSIPVPNCIISDLPTLTNNNTPTLTNNNPPEDFPYLFVTFVAFVIVFFVTLAFVGYHKLSHSPII